MGDETIRRLSTGELIRRLIDNMSSLIDRELDLAKKEARSNAARMGMGAGLLALGGLMLYTFLAALIVAATLAVYSSMGTVTPVSAALVVAAVFLVLGLVLAIIGWVTVKIQPLARTRETVKEDIEWAKSRMS